MPVYEQVHAQLASFDLTEAEGTRVRSRVKWAEEGETSSRLFLRLEKKRGTECWMLRVFASPGLLFTKTFLRPALSMLGSSQIFLAVSVFLFLLMMRSL